MKTPVNKNALRQHFTYSWWKYVLLAIFAFFGWNLIYTMTEYVPPVDKRIDFYIFATGDQELLDEYMEKVRTEQMSDMEQMKCAFQLVDDNYTPVQLTTYIAAGDGHLYMLPKDYFKTYATQAAFLPLEDVPGLMEFLEGAGVDVTQGWQTDMDTGEKHLYGIPMKQFPGFGAYAFYFDDQFLSISVANRNDENSYKFLQIFLKDMLNPPEQPIAQMF